MCVVSMVMDHYTDKWKQYLPEAVPYYPQPGIPQQPLGPTPDQIEDFKKSLQKEIEELRQLLERAKEYDRKNNEPDCELDSKKSLLKELAKKLGVEIKFL